jgi:hypothetical protein
VHNKDLTLSDHPLIEINIELANTAFQPKKSYFSKMNRSQMEINCERMEFISSSLPEFLYNLQREEKRKPT